MSIARLLLLTVLMASFAGLAARAETFDRLSTTAEPSSYDGHCPVLIKLEGVIKFDVSLNTQEKYVYRWESDREILTDYVTTFSKGRNNHVDGIIQVQEPVGTTVTMPIRLHAAWGTDFGKTHPYYGMSVNDHYSTPVMITVTCR